MFRSRNKRCWLLALAVILVFAYPATADLSQALDASVQVKTYLSLVDEKGNTLSTLEVKGSGWTTECIPDGVGHKIRIRTAAHLVNPEHLLGDTVGELWPLSLVHMRYTIRYRDGARYAVGSEGLLEMDGDSALLEFKTFLPRTTLPNGDPKAVAAGDQLRSIACPGGLLFVAHDGVFSANMDGVGLTREYPGWWLASLHAASGASGAPVINSQGEVVAQVVGRFSWPGGELAVLQPLNWGVASSRTPGEMCRDLAAEGTPVQFTRLLEVSKAAP